MKPKAMFMFKLCLGETRVPKVSSEANEREFAELTALLRFLSTTVLGIADTDPVHPGNVLDMAVIGEIKSSCWAASGD